MTTLYVTQADLEARGLDLVTLTNLSNPAAESVNTAYLNEILLDVTGTANSYLRNRYAASLPLANTPPELKRHLVALARYLLEANAPGETVAANYEFAMSFLRDVAAGRANLGLDLNDQPIPTIAQPDFDAPERTFTGDSLDQFTRDRPLSSTGGWGW